ncbi:hypothetical protein [Mucilaginibacter sp. AK015]|nr:hypothetical protein [Mucilaginibacter sp. AK015]MBB5396906.1 hypothetical protein [Mucilaginibacter sp. AK015]
MPILKVPVCTGDLFTVPPYVYSLSVSINRAAIQIDNQHQVH